MCGHFAAMDLISRNPAPPRMPRGVGHGAYHGKGKMLHSAGCRCVGLENWPQHWNGFLVTSLRAMNPRLASLCADLGVSSDLIAARGLSECEEATSLEVAEIGAQGRNHLLIPAAANAWCNMKAAAHSDGISLFIISAFRSIDRQAEIVRRKLQSGSAIEEVLRVCAPPGFSEHHTGRAVDLYTPGSRPLEAQFDQTTAFAWLSARAARFGYFLSYPVGNKQGYQYEPWHWCYLPSGRSPRDGEVTLIGQAASRTP